MAETVHTFDARPPLAAGVAGGKGASLCRMTAAGLPVPPGFVVGAAAFDAFLATFGGHGRIAALVERLDVSDASALERAAADIRQLIVSAPLPLAIAGEVRDAHARLASNDLVAVRSSAIAEDGEAASFAGQQETFLNVGPADVLRRVQDCWASFFSPRALFYRARKGVLGDTRMAVVVQQMVQADKSGVMFTVDPIRNRRDCMVIEGAPGLGEGLVSGEVTPEHYVLTRDAGLLVEDFVPDPDRRVLSEPELHDLRTLGLQVEAFFGAPQDVEWSIRGRDLLLLQSRPITTLGAHV